MVMSDFSEAELDKDLNAVWFYKAVESASSTFSKI